MPGPDDEAWRALDELIVALRETMDLTTATLGRAERLRERRAHARSFVEISQDAHHPLLVEMLSQILERQADAGSRFRRAVARALHAEGMSMDAIAELFGVTRQRVSTLIRAGEPKANGRGDGASRARRDSNPRPTA